MTQIQTGTVIDNRYTIEKLIGSGSYKTVYKAEQTNLNRVVALKFIRDANMFDVCSSTDTAKILKKEAILINLLSQPNKHPNIVEVLDFSIWNNIPYMAEEFLDGKNLESLINDTGFSYGINAALKIFSQIADAMIYSHSKRVVHSDLRPQNIMIMEENVVKVTDFGLAHLVDNSVLLTAMKANDLTGILSSYSSPSQIIALIKEDTSLPAYDILCLGNIMLQMLPKIKVNTSNRNEIEMRARLDEIILKARAEPKTRYKSMNDLLQDINELIYAKTQAAPAVTKEKRPQALNTAIDDSHRKKMGAAELYENAKTLMHSHKYTLAVDFLKNIIDLEPTHGNAWGGLQCCMINMARPDLDSIIIFCNNHTKFWKKNWQAHHTKGLALYKQAEKLRESGRVGADSKYLEAIAKYKTAIKMSNKKSYWSYHDIGNCYRGMGTYAGHDSNKKEYYKEAESFYRQALEVIPTNISNSDLHWLYYDLGDILRKQNKFAEAMDYLKKAIAQDENMNAWPHCNLAEIYLELGDRGDKKYYAEAEQSARKAISILCDCEAKHWLHYVLGRALESQGESSKARIEYYNAQRLNPYAEFITQAIIKNLDK